MRLAEYPTGRNLHSTQALEILFFQIFEGPTHPSRSFNLHTVEVATLKATFHVVGSQTSCRCGTIFPCFIREEFYENDPIYS